MSLVCQVSMEVRCSLPSTAASCGQGLAPAPDLSSLSISRLQSSVTTTPADTIIRRPPQILLHKNYRSMKRIPGLDSQERIDLRVSDDIAHVLARTLIIQFR